MTLAALLKNALRASALTLGLSLAGLAPVHAQNPAAYTADPTPALMGCGNSDTTCYGSVTQMSPVYKGTLKTCADSACSASTVTDRRGVSADALTLAQTSFDTYKSMQTAQRAVNQTPGYLFTHIGSCNEIPTNGTYDCSVYGKRYLSGAGASAVYSAEELLTSGVNVSVVKLTNSPMCNGYAPSLGCPNTSAGGINSAASLSGQICPVDMMSDAMVAQCLQNPGLGNPISVVTGGKVETKTDLAWPIAFSRAYASDRATSFSMGAWRHNHDSKVLVTMFPMAPSVPMALEFKLENDESAVFVRASATAPFIQTGLDQKSYKAELNAEGYLLTLPNYEKRQYAAVSGAGTVGFMSWRKARNGYQYNYAYDASGRLIQILDSYQRGLTVAYTGASTLIASVTSVGVASSAVDTVSYSYTSSLLATAAFNATEVTSYTYTAGKLTGVTDPLNNAYASFSYQADGRAIQSKHIADGASINQVDLSYGANTITATLNGASNVYTMARDSNTAKNHITSATLGGSLTSYSIGYNANGQANRLTAGTLSNTYAISLTTMLPSSRSREDGQTITYGWDVDQRLMTSVTEPSPQGTRSTSMGYDGSGNLTSLSVLSGAGETRAKAWSYGSYGKLQSFTDVDGSVTSYDYHSDTDATPELRGQLKKITNPLGQFIEILSYDARGNPTIMTDANGVQTAFSYDARGRELTRSRLGASLTKTYDLAGQLKTVASSTGETLTLSYDTAHRLKSVVSGTGEKTSYAYDAHSNVAQTNFYKGAALELTVNNTYTALRQPKSSWKSAVTEARSMTYNANGSVATSVDGLNRSSTYGYDTLGNPRTLTEPGMSSTFTRDLDGNLTSYAGGSVTTTAYSWNDFKELLSVSSVDSKNQTLTHDAVNRIETMTDNAGVKHTSSNDALGRLTELKHEKTGSATLTETMAYDQGANAAGRPSSASNGAASYAWTWNSQGLVESKTQTVGAINLALQYGYDAQGQLTSITYPSGMVAGYDWSLGRVSAVRVNGQILISNIAYRVSTGEPVSWNWASGGSYVKSFDANGKVSGVSDSGFIAQTTAFDGALRLTNLTDSASGSFSLIPSYATGDQIASVNVNGASSSYLFDSNWNRTKRTTPALVDTISMTALTNLPYQVATAPGTTKPVSYDSNNNVANNGRGAFVYDMKNNLAQATVSSVVSSYAYDMHSRRVSKTVGSATTLFMHDDAGNLAGEYSAAGVAASEHIYLGALPIGVSAGGSINSVHTDYLGTPRVITSGMSVVWKWDATDPFGSNAPSIAQIVYNPRFAGQYYDTETGLHYNHYRTYDPQMGRYMQPDPLGLAAGKNPFNYVNQNPLNASDPDGLECQAVFRSNIKMTRCEFPGIAIFEIPAPKGFPDKLVTSEFFYHAYHLKHAIGDADPRKVVQGLINVPTPGAGLPATKNGTANYADVDFGLDCLYEAYNVLNFHNEVTSFVTKNLLTGGVVVVNISGDGWFLWNGGVFKDGYVAKTLIGKTVHTVGEGNSKLQKGFIPWTRSVIDKVNRAVWNPIVEGAINGAKN